MNFLDCLLRGSTPTPVFLPGESHGRRSLVGYSPRGRKESDTTEQLHFTFTEYYIVEEKNLKPRHKENLTYFERLGKTIQGSENRVALDISTKILEISTQWSSTIKILKEKHFELKRVLPLYSFSGLYRRWTPSKWVSKPRKMTKWDVKKQKLHHRRKAKGTPRMIVKGNPRASLCNS